MMAKKAAERAKKEFEDRMAKEAENRRLSQIPQWKRDLLARREETENKLKYRKYSKVEMKICFLYVHFLGLQFTRLKWRRIIVLLRHGTLRTELFPLTTLT